MPTEKVKEQIIAQIAPEVSKLQNQSDRLLQMALHDLILQWLRDSAIALAYGFGFPGLGIRGGVIATNSFGVKHKIHTRPWKQDDQNPMAP